MRPDLLPPWTADEDARLALAYVTGGIAAAREALPGRSEAALYHRARRLSASRRRRWTAADDLALSNMWEDGYALRSIASKLGRTQATTYWRAQRLGLRLGVPPGFEGLSAAAERSGYAVASLRRILAWAHVRIRRTLSRPCGSVSGKRFHFVDPLDVDDAIAAWIKTETAEAAARRLGISGDRLRARLRTVGVEVPGRARHSRVTERDLQAAARIARRADPRASLPEVP